MKGNIVYSEGSDYMGLLENSNSLWLPSTSSSFHETMVNFDNEGEQLRRVSLKREYIVDEDDTGGEDFETSRYQPEKKRRLSVEQVELLEKSFDEDNKLEPERKIELAKQLRLQPRQVAIWFQNRRARYKTKLIEKEYGSLKASYDRLMVDFDTLTKERHNLQNEVNVLTKKLKERDEAKHMNPTDLIDRDRGLIMPKLDTGLVMAPINTEKQLVEDENSAKSDILDSESPHYTTDGNHSSIMEDPLDPHSDFSQDEEEYLMTSNRLLLPSTVPLPLTGYNTLLKVEDNGFYDSNSSSCNFSLVDEPPFWSMLY